MFIEANKLSIQEDVQRMYAWVISYLSMVFFEVDTPGFSDQWR